MNLVSALRGLLAAVILSTSVLWAPAASADTFTWNVKNSHPHIMEVQIYSRDRDAVWPAGGEVYYLDSREEQQIYISCMTGEYICYGAWVSGQENGSYWGVGPGGKKGCQNCCYECNGGESRLFNFTE